jgi:hypothetical protein
MRQLTNLDAQFLAMESPTTYGHVSSLAVYESDSELTADDVRALIEERLHLLPPFRWRLAPVPFGLDNPYPVSMITDAVGLNITVLSYRDRMDFGIVCDREQIDDPWPLIDGLRDALEESKQLVPEPGGRSSKVAAKVGSPS